MTKLEEIKERAKIAYDENLWPNVSDNLKETIITQDVPWLIEQAKQAKKLRSKHREEEKEKLCEIEIVDSPTGISININGIRIVGGKSWPGRSSFIARWDLAPDEKIREALRYSK